MNANIILKVIFVFSYVYETFNNTGWFYNKLDRNKLRIDGKKFQHTC